jgi:hypothetical protein
MNTLKVNSVKPIHEFIKEIDDLVKKSKIDYIDAVIFYCEKNGIEIETAASLIKSSSKIKAKIQNEAEEMNYLPRSAKLPI